MLAILIWWLPLPRRLQVRLTEVVYSHPPMSAKRAAETLAVLQVAAVGVLVMGGWGVDALVGEERRRHHDLDLIVDHRDMGTAVNTLHALGYEEWYHGPSMVPLGDLEPMGDSIVLRDAEMRVVDLHPAAVRDSGAPAAQGTIGGQPVPCLSPEQQIRAHQGYDKPWRRKQRNGRSDLRVVQSLIDSESRTFLE